MNNRAINMKRVSVTRSAEVQAMLALLTDLDNGTDGDFDGFEKFGIQYSQQMRGRINSYRAQKIAKYLANNTPNALLTQALEKVIESSNIRLGNGRAYSNVKDLIN